MLISYEPIIEGDDWISIFTCWFHLKFIIPRYKIEFALQQLQLQLLVPTFVGKSLANIRFLVLFRSDGRF